jgi:hypothetical protein
MKSSTSTAVQCHGSLDQLAVHRSVEDHLRASPIRTGGGPYA